MSHEPVPGSFTFLTDFFVPETFWPAIGAPHSAEWLGVFWRPIGNEVCLYEQGDLLTANRDAFVTLLTYYPNEIALRRAGFDRKSFGHPLGRATHWLLLHRPTRHVWAAPRAEARRYLQRSRPRSTPTCAMPTAQQQRFVRQLATALIAAPRPNIALLLQEEAERVATLRQSLYRN